MVRWFLEPLSTYAENIDSVIGLIAILVFFWAGLTYLMFFWLLFRYRAKDGVKAEYVTGKEKALKRWISWPHALIIVCDIFIIVAAVKVWYEVKQDMPEPDAEVRVMSQQWAWSFQHPGPDGVLDTEDDIKTVDDLHIEAGKTYHYRLESRDVLHSFSVPVFRLKQDAVPGRVIKGWFKAKEGQTGVYDIQCAEMCGIGHGLMPARIIIETAEEHKAWMAGQNDS